jgi:tungstate transport system substrate-binding protein
VLSGGEQQRLALARAWALHPEVLFLDEPTASLDPSATREIETVIRAFDAAGTKVVMATHNLGQARLGGRGLVPASWPPARAERRGRVLRPPPQRRGARVPERRPPVVKRLVLLAAALLALPARAPTPRPPRRPGSASARRPGAGLRAPRRPPPRLSREDGDRGRDHRRRHRRALALAERGDVDLVLSCTTAPRRRPSSPPGTASTGKELFYNRFLLAGPASDPARVTQASRRGGGAPPHRRRQGPFASRGDDSGTNKAELGSGSRQASTRSRRAPAGTASSARAWARALNTASELGAYVLVDDATWGTFQNKRELTALLERRPALRNVYSVILLSPAKQPAVKHDEARALASWLASEEGQRAVAAFAPQGKPLFRPLLLGGDGVE